VDFPIPANDDASKSIVAVMDVIVQAVAEGLQERKSDKDKAAAEKESAEKAEENAKVAEAETTEAPAKEAKEGDAESASS
jgi:small subunit ribosomal protein S2